MYTVTEVIQKLASIEAQEGKDAVHTWIAEHAQELPEDIRGEIITRYTVDAVLEDAEEQPIITQAMEEGEHAMEFLEEDKRAIETELKTRDTKERLGMEE